MLAGLDPVCQPVTAHLRVHEVLGSVLLGSLLPGFNELCFLPIPRTSRFASFPEYLVVQIKKFTFGLDWIPKKLGMCLFYLPFYPR